MGKINILLICSMVFLCGCNKQPSGNSAKIDALSQKLDTVLQNQADIKALLSAFHTNEMTAMYYYYTNQFAADRKVEGFMLDRMSTNFVTVQNQLIKLNWKATQSVASALPTTKQPDDVDRVRKEERVREAEIEEIKSQVDDMQEDLREIKAKLGVD
jgi:hypothetical protein